MSDPYWDNTVLALRFDGAHGSSVFTDLKGHTITATAGVTISTAQSRSGGASGYFPGTAQLSVAPLSSEFALGTGDFSVDFHFFDTADDTVRRSIFGCYAGGQAPGTYAPQCLYESRSRTLWFVLGNASPGYSYLLPQPLYNRWNHLAFARKNGVFACYQEGLYVANSAVIGGGILPGTSLTANGFSLGPVTSYNPLKGFVDNFRIVKGMSAFNGPFTPPTTFFGYRASGTVKDTGGAFAARIVRAYNRTNGNLVGQAVSSALDGTFDIALVTPDPHYVICLDDDSGDELEALIFDRVMPVL